MGRRNRRTKAADEGLRLIGYCRVSTEEQSREGVSLDAQEARLQAYAVGQGHELVGVEIDAGISGKVAPAKRPGMAQALARVRAGEADGIVALKLDRLSRSTRDVLDLVEEFDRADFRLISVSESLDTGSASGRLVVTVLAALSQMEREQTSERTILALDEIGHQGRGRSRFTPYGWRNADGEAENRAGDRRELVPHAAEQAALKRIIKQRKAGKGARRIASSLKGSNPRSGKAWTANAVAAILRRLDRWEDAGIEPLAA